MEDRNIATHSTESYSARDSMRILIGEEGNVKMIRRIKETGN